MAPLLALAVYGMGYRAAIEPVMSVLMALSYLRYGIVGFCNAIFSNRPFLHCKEEEIYCHYRDPEVLMIDMGMSGYSYNVQVLCILGFMVLFRVFAYVALKYRLKSELSTKIVHIYAKLIKEKV